MRWYSEAVDVSLTSQRREVLQAQLDAAGAAYMISPAEFLVIRRIVGAAGAAVSVAVIFGFSLRDPLHITIAAALVPLSFLYPDLRLREVTKRRQSRFEKDFPFFLDVLVLAMKAGLNFIAALEQAVGALRDGPVKQEFSRCLRESRAGLSRRAALDRLAARIMLPSVTNFAAAVSQAEQTGGSLGDVLSDQARQRRQERFLRAEKLANQAPVKILFPLIALLFPTTFIIIGFPIVIQLLEAGALDLF
ncbi:type II secretion system F family protein [Peristeroidobacter agariperforans]|uniref:type II secretion system F family protein n=1 Tax=Peristeroidobacter agariperforans TaxID=268404 RepID=UPI0013004B6C|nr:type II secretion system F family protein [Peristeroidobacter agariperforans]